MSLKVKLNWTVNGFSFTFLRYYVPHLLDILKLLTKPPCNKLVGHHACIFGTSVYCLVSGIVRNRRPLNRRREPNHSERARIAAGRIVGIWFYFGAHGPGQV